MPELPEIETIKRTLMANQGAKIDKIKLNREDIIRRRDFPLGQLQNKSIGEIARRGKYLWLVLDRDHNIIIHLGMSGRFYQLDETSAEAAKHVHAEIYLSNGKKLVFEDPRRFGGIYLLNDPREFFGRLGAEPLTEEFNPAYLNKITRQRKIAIKSLLLNQNLISGIGNIYADEALFRAGIRPDRAAGSLTAAEIDSLCGAIKQVLNKSIDAQGTTFRDYRNGFNQEGSFQKYLQVYGREKEQCTRCGEIIYKQTIGGRGSHFCVQCQK